MNQKNLLFLCGLVFANLCAAYAQPPRPSMPHLRHRQALAEADTQNLQKKDGSDSLQAQRTWHPMPPRPPMMGMSWEQQDSLMAYRAERGRKNRKLMQSYGSNFIRFYPICIIDINAIAFGMDYEHLFLKNKMIGFVLPVIYSSKEKFISADNDLEKQPAIIYFCPGIKVYPFGQRTVTYAIGPSLFLGFGKDTFYPSSNTPTTPAHYGESVSVRRIGYHINNYLNVQFSKNFSLSAQFGLGARRMNKTIFKDNTSFEREHIESANFSIGFGLRI